MITQRFCWLNQQRFLVHKITMSQIEKRILLWKILKTSRKKAKKMKKKKIWSSSVKSSVLDWREKREARRKKEAPEAARRSIQVSNYSLGSANWPVW